MSKEERLSYSIEAQRRRELHLERVRQTATTYLSRHAEVMEDLRRQGLDTYVGEEVSAVRRELARAQGLLDRDPEAARQASIEIGARLHGLPSYARTMFRAAREAELAAKKVAEERALQNLEEAWRERLSAWDNPLEVQLAAPSLATLRKELLQAGSSASIATMDAGLARARTEAKQKADAIRLQAALEAEAEAKLELETQLAAAGVGSTGSAVSALDMTQALAKVIENGDEASVSESVRREVVRAVNQTLIDAGFVVEKPKRVKAGDIDEVVLRATRASGAEATFRVDLSGIMNYEFDRYEGTACRQDIDQVLPTLQSVYGITLSDRRVIWENPDDLQQDARPRPGSKRNRTNG